MHGHTLFVCTRHGTQGRAWAGRHPAPSDRPPALQHFFMSSALPGSHDKGQFCRRRLGEGKQSGQAGP